MTVNYVQLRGLEETALYTKEQTTGKDLFRSCTDAWRNAASCRVWGSTELISIIL